VDKGIFVLGNGMNELMEMGSLWHSLGPLHDGSDLRRTGAGRSLETFYPSSLGLSSARILGTSRTLLRNLWELDPLSLCP
jgi:hypothetical protein